MLDESLNSELPRFYIVESVISEFNLFNLAPGKGDWLEHSLTPINIADPHDQPRPFLSIDNGCGKYRLLVYELNSRESCNLSFFACKRHRRLVQIALWSIFERYIRAVKHKLSFTDETQGKGDRLSVRSELESSPRPLLAWLYPC